MSRTFIFILLMLLPLTSRSQTTKVEGIVYEIDTMIEEIVWAETIDTGTEFEIVNQ